MALLVEALGRLNYQNEPNGDYADSLIQGNMDLTKLVRSRQQR